MNNFVEPGAIPHRVYIWNGGLHPWICDDASVLDLRVDFPDPKLRDIWMPPQRKEPPLPLHTPVLPSENKQILLVRPPRARFNHLGAGKKADPSPPQHLFQLA